MTTATINYSLIADSPGLEDSDSSLDPRAWGAEPDAVHWLDEYAEPEVVVS
jgi:hypothetical protein